MTHPILRLAFERHDERGVLRELLTDGAWETILTGEMRAGAVMGNHYHRLTQVYFYLQSGGARIRTIGVDSGERDDFTLAANEAVLLKTGESHSITFVQDSQFILLKSRRYDANDPDTYAYVVPE